MTNQPDIVQPRIRRTGKSGNTPAVLAEQSTRVLIRVPRLSASAIQPATTQIQLTQPQSIKPQAIQPPSIQPQTLHAKPPVANLAAAPTTSEQIRYSTTMQQLQGSATAKSPAVAPSPSISRQSARIDAAHTATTGPHSAPDWLNDRSRNTNTVMQTRLLLLVGAIAGFALGALTWHSHGTRVPATQSSASRIQAPTQGAADKSSSAVNVTDTAAAEFNVPAQVSQADTGRATSKESASSTWQWNPKEAANSPATIGQNGTGNYETDTANAAAAATPSDVQANDPSRAAWLQGTIDTVHSTSAPVQR